MDSYIQSRDLQNVHSASCGTVDTEQRMEFTKFNSELLLGLFS